jgi:hypothetical protein
MSHKVLPALLGGVVGMGLWLGGAGPGLCQPAPLPPPPAGQGPGALPPPVAQGGPVLPPALPPAAPLPGPYHTLNRFYYYPYYYFPFDYWPTTCARWPEPVGQPYMRPPAYMAYPPFREPHWRYDLWESMRYYRGSHFWLDQF